MDLQATPPLTLLPPLMAAVLLGLRQAIGIWSGREPASGALAWVAHFRVQRALARFAALVALVVAGQRRVDVAGPRVRASRAGQPGGRVDGVRVPTKPGWLAVRVFETRAYGSQLQHLLTTPDMAAFLAAVPEGWRVLAPVCRMMGVAVPETAKRRSPRNLASDDVAGPEVADEPAHRPGEAAPNVGVSGRRGAAMPRGWRDPGWWRKR